MNLLLYFHQHFVLQGFSGSNLCSEYSLCVPPKCSADELSDREVCFRLRGLGRGYEFPFSYLHTHT